MENVYAHPTALVESETIGSGTRIWAYAHVMAGAEIGAHCNIGDHCFVERGAVVGSGTTLKNGNMIWEGVTLEEGVFVGPHAFFTNDRYPRSARLPEAEARHQSTADWLVPTLVQRGASIGAGAVIVAGVTIGAFAMVGAGAVVTRDVLPQALVVGNPARQRGWVCLCGLPLRFEGAEATCPTCGRAFHEQAGQVELRPKAAGPL